jgi:hypothetical protein
MARVALLLAAVALAWGCNDEGSEALSCALLSPTTGAFAHGLQAVEVGVTGPVERVELLAADAVVSSADVTEALQTVTLTWDTTAGPDGPVVLTARALGAGAAEALGAPVLVEVDNTAPVVAFVQERFGLVRGSVVVPLELIEAHPATVSVRDQFGTIYEGALEGASFEWDASAAEDRLHWLDLDVTDAAGNVGSVRQFPLIVVNHHSSAPQVEYDPEARLAVPANYATAEYDTRGMVPTHAGVARIISWITWDASSGWLVEYSIGQGLCPHRGIEFASAESRSGEIVIDLGRDELAEAVVARFPADERDRSTFPANAEPLTFGIFFGHARPLEPAEHIGESVPIEMHVVLIDQAPTP